MRRYRKDKLIIFLVILFIVLGALLATTMVKADNELRSKSRSCVCRLYSKKTGDYAGRWSTSLLANQMDCTATLATTAADECARDNFKHNLTCKN